MRTVNSVRIALLSWASALPTSVNCHTFCLRSSFLIILECSCTSFSFNRLLIVLETFGGCSAHASAIPGRVTALVTMNWSACSKFSNRCNKILSRTATETFGNSLGTTCHSWAPCSRISPCSSEFSSYFAQTNHKPFFTIRFAGLWE